MIPLSAIALHWYGVSGAQGAINEATPKKMRKN
jgi:hypothetical protein